MNNALVKQERSNPRMLVLLFFGATILSVLLQYFGVGLLYRIFSYGTGVILVQAALHFPLWQPCIAWLSARSSRTSPATWIVPSLLLLLVFAVPVLLPVLQMILLGFGGLSMFLWMGWEYSIKPSILLFVLLSFLFRVSTLHLRPVESPPSLHRLRVATIMFFTVIVAVCMSIDSLIHQTLQPDFASFFFIREFVYFLLSLAALTANALLWFSIAWLFVAGNPKRWIGILGIAIFLVYNGVLHFWIYPLYATQNAGGSGSGLNMFDSTYYLGLFVISIVIVFLCVGAMHWAGYRWDIYRPSQTDAGVRDERLAEEPIPVVVSRIEI